MQKVLRININTRNQTIQHLRRKKLKEIRKEWKKFEEATVTLNRATRKLVKDEQKHRREDWIAGPLAPRRDVGERQGAYGALESMMVLRPQYPAAVSKAPHSKGHDIFGQEGISREGLPLEWEGYGNDGNLAEGDRVCVVRGHEAIRGKIGVIGSIDTQTRHVTIDDFNTVDVQRPPNMAVPGQPLIQKMSAPIPIDDVRLVFRHTVLDPITNRIVRDRDVLVNRIRGGAPYIQREYGSNLPRHTRYVAGENIEIKWPERSSEPLAPHPGDTRRQSVDRRTFVPSIYDDPLPHSSILDELRPKYAHGRENHERDYVSQKIVEDARSSWYESRGMDTPPMELRKKLHEQGNLRAKALREKIQDISDVDVQLRILLQETQLAATLPALKGQLIKKHETAGEVKPELHAETDLVQHQLQWLSETLDAVRNNAAKPKAELVEAVQDKFEELEMLENEEMNEGNEIEEELIVHEAPDALHTKPKRQ